MTGRLTICLSLVLGSCLLSPLFSVGPQEGRALADGSTAPSVEAPLRAPSTEAPPSQAAFEHSAPKKAYALLEALKQRHGEPLPGYVGGRVFHNRERRLPLGRYKEYDVNRKVPGRSRDAERIVIEQTTGKAYYSGDHYRTFLPLN
jgi:ribonuclease T1